jgi:hypothetical protein
MPWEYYLTLRWKPVLRKREACGGVKQGSPLRANGWGRHALD